MIDINNDAHNKKPTIILVSGKAQNGKDLFTETFIQNIENSHKDNKCLRIAYGDFVKFVCEKYFGWNGLKDKEGRTLLQFVGTDLARTIHPDIWVNMAIDLIKGIGGLYNYILIPDTRFENEVQRWIDNEYRVSTVRVKRLGFESTLTIDQQNHISETALDEYFFDYYIEASNKNELSEGCQVFIRDVLLQSHFKNVKIRP